MNARDAVDDFEHSHTELNELVLELGRLVAKTGGEDASAPVRRRIAECLDRLGDRLLLHFAKEEEGLFPFVRAALPEVRERIDRLEAGHDGICGAVVRLLHLAHRDPRTLEAYIQPMLPLLERFERAYARHSQEESELLRELGRRLDTRRRAELTALLHGL